MTDEYRKKLNEAAEAFFDDGRFNCHSILFKLKPWESREIASFKSGAQFVLDNPPEEWRQLKAAQDHLSNVDRRAIGDIMLENKRLAEAFKTYHADVEALVDAAEKMLESTNEYEDRIAFNLIQQALAPFRKGEK